MNYISETGTSVAAQGNRGVLRGMVSFDRHEGSWRFGIVYCGAVLCAALSLCAAGPIAQSLSKAPNSAIVEHAKPLQVAPDTPKIAFTAEKRGTLDAPIVVKVLPAERTKAEINLNEQDRIDKSKTDQEQVNLNRYLVLIGIGQAFIFLLQFVVFGYQAMKLRETVVGAAEQSILMRNSLAENAKAAKAMVDSVVVSRDQARAANRQVSAMQDQARALRSALAVEAPSLLVYGLGDIVKREDSDGRIAYEMTYQVANLGRAPAIIERVRAGVQADPSKPYAPPPAPPWHQLSRAAVVPANTVVPVSLQFPYDEVDIEGCYLPDYGGEEFDYYIPKNGTNPTVIVEIIYRGATTTSRKFGLSWKFDREHTSWVS